MATGDPIGIDLVSGTTDGSTLPESPTLEEREVSLGAGYALISGTQYAIVVRNSATASADAITITGQIYPNADYADGVYADSDDAGVNWSQDDWIDLWFKTKAGAVEKDIYTDTGYSNNNVYGAKWYAQTFTASSSYTITSVVLRIGQYGGGTPGTITVGIRDVEPAVPTKANTPAPANAATDVTLDQATITWVDGGGSDTYNVYYGDTSGDLTKVSSAQAGLSYTVTGITLGSPYDYIVTRYWRIDSTNAGGTTTGDEWSFTTLRFDPPRVIYFYSTTGQYYQLLVQADGTYGDHPADGGVENTDYVFLSAGYEPNFISTTRKLIAVANSKVWIEDL